MMDQYDMMGPEAREAREAMSRLYNAQIRSDSGRALRAYQALPWWRRLLTKRPDRPLVRESDAT
jgi:hypothetical protein